jgi:hypothetical protein
MTDREHTGVWLSDMPPGYDSGPDPDPTRLVLIVNVPDEVAEECEWVQDGLGYREFLVPAAVLNACGAPRVVPDNEAEDEADEEL